MSKQGKSRGQSSRQTGRFGAFGACFGAFQHHTTGVYLYVARTTTHTQAHARRSSVVHLHSTPPHELTTTPYHHTTTPQKHTTTPHHHNSTHIYTD
nr:MAG TPA: hypothetical protein [Caudoviricetes sp.]